MRSRPFALKPLRSIVDDETTLKLMHDLSALMTPDIEESFLSQRDQLGLPVYLDQLPEGYRLDQMVVLIAGFNLGGVGLFLYDNVHHLAAESQLVLRQLIIAGFPGGSSNTTLRKLEDVVQAPGDISYIVEEFSQNAS